MKAKEIQIGEIYMFVATDDPMRQHLAEKSFTPSVPVYSHKWAGIKKGYIRSIKGFKNADGEFARAEELEPMP